MGSMARFVYIGAKAKVKTTSLLDDLRDSNYMFALSSNKNFTSRSHSLNVNEP